MISASTSEVVVMEIGDAFTLHPVPKLISFTGSTKVGSRIG